MSPQHHLRSRFAGRGPAPPPRPRCHLHRLRAREAVGGIAMNPSICVQTKRGPAGVSFNLAQGSLKDEVPFSWWDVTLPSFLLASGSSSGGGTGGGASDFLPFGSWFPEAEGRGGRKDME